MRITTFIIFLVISTVLFSQDNFTTGLHIGYNSSTFLGKDKPGKKEYKYRHVPKDHPWRRLNQKITDDKKRNYLIATLG